VGNESDDTAVVTDALDSFLDEFWLLSNFGLILRESSLGIIIVLIEATLAGFCYVASPDGFNLL